jgi:putative oxidoreductase
VDVKKGVALLRRLYSTFAGGWPGVGLLLMRVVVGSALIIRATATLRSGAPTSTMVPAVLLTLCGVLIIPGLWTPIAGTSVALLELLKVMALPGDPWVRVLLGTLGGALALLGPGLWSIDARLFGWKRVEAPPRRSTPPTF